MSNEVQIKDSEDFDLNSIFSDGGSDSPIGSIEEVFECEKPHWRVSKEDLKKVLQIISSFPSKATVYMAVSCVGDSLQIHANNRDALIDVSLVIQNSDHYKTNQVYFLDTTKLLAFVNSYQSFVLSFDEDGTIYYESPYVRYKLDTVKVGLKDIQINYDLPKQWLKFPLSKSEIGVLRTLYGFAVRLSDSKVLINSNRAEAFYALYKYDVQVDTQVKENVIIRRLDLFTLKEIVDDSTEFAFDDKRLYFRFGLGIVSFLRVPYDENSFMYPETFLTGDNVGKFVLDVPLVKRALKLTTLFNVEDVDFVSEDSDIYLWTSDKAKFKVGSCQQGLSGSFSIGLDMFSKLVGTINSDVLDVSVSEHGIQLVAGREVYSLARTSISQIKQGKLHPVLTKPQSQTVQAAEFQDSEVL